MLADKVHVWLQTRLAQVRGALLSKSRLRYYQELRAQRLLPYVAQRSPFYQELWRGRNIRAWHGLPLTNRAMLSAAFPEANTLRLDDETARDLAELAEERSTAAIVRGRDQRRLYVGLSLGTAGTRRILLTNQHEQRALAGMLLARLLPRRRRVGYRVALLGISNSALYATVDTPGVVLRTSAPQVPLADLLPALQSFAPHMLVAPPSLLVALAQATEAGTLSLALDRLLATGELLHAPDHAVLTRAFGVSPGQVYLAAEGLLAAPCAYGRLHLMEDMMAFQMMPVPGLPGSYVQPVLTDLWRTTQPRIRYQLDDVLRLDPQPCPCGSHFQVIAAIEGRVDDLCQLPARSGSPRVVLPSVLAEIIQESSPAIQDYQLVQTANGALNLALATDPGADSAAVVQAAQQHIERTLVQQGFAPPPLAISIGIPPLPAGVVRRRVQRAREERG